MSARCPNPQGSLRPAAPAGLWSGSYCAGCPAQSLCVDFNTDRACGHPSEYPEGSAHPESRAATSGYDDFCFPSFKLRDRAVAHVPPHLLVISDGTLTPNVKLKHLLAAVRRTSSKDRTGCLAVLHGSDEYLYRLRGLRGSLGRRLKDAGFVGAIGPGFSTWEQHPPFSSLLAQALSAHIATEVDALLPTIPTIVWRTHDELGRWADWLLENGRQTIALHPGPLRTVAEWEWWTAGLSQLRDLLKGQSVHAYVNGPCTHARLADVVNVWGPTVTFMTQHPWATAVKGKLLSGDDFSASFEDSEERSDAERLALNESLIAEYLRALIRGAQAGLVTAAS